MQTAQDQHRRFLLYVDLPAELSENEVAEIVGGVENDLIDAYPEEASGGSYFHNLKLDSLVATGSAPAPAGTCRYRVHLDLFDGADSAPDILDTIVEQANEALPKYAPAGDALPAARFSVAERSSDLLRDPSCFWCNPRQD